MGQKTNSVGLRLGIHRKWKTIWFAENKNYTKFLFLNFKIDSFLKGFFAYNFKKTLLIDSKILKQSWNKIFIFVFFYRYRFSSQKRLRKLKQIKSAKKRRKFNKFFWKKFNGLQFSLKENVSLTLFKDIKKNNILFTKKISNLIREENNIIFFKNLLFLKEFKKNKYIYLLYKQNLIYKNHLLNKIINKKVFYSIFLQRNRVFLKNNKKLFRNLKNFFSIFLKKTISLKFLQKIFFFLNFNLNNFKIFNLFFKIKNFFIKIHKNFYIVLFNFLLTNKQIKVKSNFISFFWKNFTIKYKKKIMKYLINFTKIYWFLIQNAKLFFNLFYKNRIKNLIFFFKKIFFLKKKNQKIKNIKKTLKLLKLKSLNKVFLKTHKIKYNFQYSLKKKIKKLKYKIKKNVLKVKFKKNKKNILKKKYNKYCFKFLKLLKKKKTFSLIKIKQYTNKKFSLFFQKKKLKNILINKDVFFAGNAYDYTINSIKKALRILTKTKINLIFINTLSLLKFESKLKRNHLLSELKPKTVLRKSFLRFSFMEQKLYRKYKHIAVLISDMVNILFITLLLKKPDILAGFIALQIKKLPFNRNQIKFVYFIIKILINFSAARKEILGLMVKIKGRFKKWRRTKTIAKISGNIPFQRFDTRIEYGSATGFVKKGAFGVHIWLYYNPLFKREMSFMFQQYFAYSIKKEIKKRNAIKRRLNFFFSIANSNIKLNFMLKKKIHFLTKYLKNTFFFQGYIKKRNSKFMEKILKLKNLHKKKVLKDNFKKQRKSFRAIRQQKYFKPMWKFYNVKYKISLLFKKPLFLNFNKNCSLNRTNSIFYFRNFLKQNKKYKVNSNSNKKHKKFQQNVLTNKKKK